MAHATSLPSPRLQRLRRRVWGLPGAGPGTLGLRALRLVLLTWQAFRRNHLTIHASGLTFYLLLSVVPFLAFLLLVLRAFQVAERLRPYLLAFVAGGNPELVPRIDEYIRNAQSATLGGLGIAVTFLVGFLLLLRVKASLNVIWNVSVRPSYRSRLIEYAAVLVVAPVLLAAATSISGFVGSPMVLQYVPDLFVTTLPSLPLANLTGYLIVVLLTMYAYCFLPDARVHVKPALLGALVAGTGLILVQQFYVVLLVVVTQQSPIYGALVLLPFMMLWFYFAWLAFLAGAQLSHVTQHYERELELHRAGESALAHRPYLMLLVLATLLRRLAGTGKGVRRRELTAALRLPGDTLDTVLRTLCDAGLITPVLDDPDRYVPQEVLERLTVLDVLQRCGLMPGFPDMPLWHGHPAGQSVLSLFRESNQALAALLAGTTLGELAQRLGPTEAQAAPEGHAAG